MYVMFSLKDPRVLKIKDDDPFFRKRESLFTGWLYEDFFSIL